MKMIKGFVFDPKEVRRKLGMNQQEFWSKIGVTQSGGSRYESGRRMPKSVQELLRVVHVEGIDLSKIHRVDFEIVEYLKTHEPAIYQSLCNQSRRAVPQDVAPTPLGQAAPMVPHPKRPSLAASTPVKGAVEDFEPEIDEIDDAGDGDWERQGLSASGESDDGSLLYEETHAMHAKRRY